MGADYGAAATGVGARVVGYGTAPDAPVRAISVDESPRGLRMTVATPRGGLPLFAQAGRAVQRPQRAGGSRRGRGAWPGPRCGQARAGVGERREGTHAAHRRGSAVHRHRRLRPHARFAGQGARQPRAARRSRRWRAGRRVRLGRGAGHRQAADDGSRRRRAGTPGGGHGRGSARRGPPGHPRRDCRRRRGHGQAPDLDLLLIADRRAAIRAAFEQARRGDVVVLCGKGHEQTIEMATGSISWDEPTVAREELAALGYGDAGGGDAAGVAEGRGVGAGGQGAGRNGRPVGRPAGWDRSGQG